MNIRLLAFSSCAGLIVAVFASAVNAACMPVTEVPSIISAPGKYCLSQDVSINDGRAVAITIDSDDVSLDLQGFAIRGPHYGGVATVSGSVGVSAHGVSNITVRNGKIIGFGTGVHLGSSRPLVGGHLVEKMHIAGGASVGISVHTRDTIIRDNRITSLNGNLSSGTTSNTVRGILMGNIWGARLGNKIINNSITGFDGSSLSAGVQIQRGPDVLVEGNYFQSGNRDGFYGIHVSASFGVTVVENRFHELGTAVFYDLQSYGKYFGNITESVGAAYVGGTDIGQNF